MSTTDPTHPDTATSVAREDLFMFDPAAAGRTRALTEGEWHQLEPRLLSSAAWNEKVADEVAARDAAPDAHPYNPRAEWGDPEYRHPASDAEAAARTEHVQSQLPTPEDQADKERASQLLAREPESVATGIDMYYAGLQHDPDELADATARHHEALDRDIANGLLPPEAAHSERGEDDRGDTDAGDVRAGAVRVGEELGDDTPAPNDAAYDPSAGYLEFMARADQEREADLDALHAAWTRGDEVRRRQGVPTEADQLARWRERDRARAEVGDRFEGRQHHDNELANPKLAGPERAADREVADPEVGDDEFEDEFEDEL